MVKLRRRKTKPTSKRGVANGRANEKSRGTKYSGMKPPKKTYTCSYCVKGFDQLINLVYHVRIHTKEKPYKCDLCSYVATQISHINVHQRVRLPVDMLQFWQCVYCDLKFCTIQALSRHRRIHVHEAKGFETTKMGSTGAETDSYKLGDRIFAKIRGYPHWPAQVTERRSGPVEEYCVAFYGSHEIAYVKPSMMCLYNDESIKKYAVGYSTKKKSSRSSILTFQKAMEECAANINFVPVDVDGEDEIEEEDDWQNDSAVDPLANKNGRLSRTSAEEIDPIPKRGRPPKAVALKNLNVVSNTENIAYSNPDQMSHDFESDTQVITHGSDSDDVEIPIIVTNVESLSGKIHPDEVQNSPPSVEELELDESVNQHNGLNNIVSRSGRKIKPKIFADSEVESPVRNTEYLKSTVGNLRPLPQKKRKASFDEPVELVKKIALEKKILTMPLRKPRKSVSISIDSEDGNLTELSNDVTEIGSVKRGAPKKRFLSKMGESASISWKEDAMTPLQDKLIKSCKRLQTFQMEVENTSETVITTPVRDKLAAASVSPLAISAAPLTQPVISKSMGAIAKIVAGDSNKKAKLGQTAKKSVGTSTSELKEDLHVDELATLYKDDLKESDRVENVKKLEEEVETSSISTDPVPVLVSSPSTDDEHCVSHAGQDTEKANLAANLQSMAETSKRVTFGGTMTKNLDESTKPIASTPVSTNKRKVTVTPSSIMKKARIASPEKKKEDSSVGRSHLQRRVEVPLRYKDSTTSPKDNGKPILTLKKTESTTTEIAVSARNSNDDSPKAFVNGSNGNEVDNKLEKRHTNGLETAPDSEEDENIELTEADFPDDQTKQRFKLQTKAKDVMETVVRLINSAMETDQNLDVALDMLVKLSEDGFVDKIMIKSYPDIVHVVRKMRHFVGNPKALKLTKAQKAEFPTKTEKIREQARKTLEGFKELMTTNTKPLAVLIMEEMRRQNCETLS